MLEASQNYDVVFLASIDMHIGKTLHRIENLAGLTMYYRSIGTYKLRTHIENIGYKAKVIDYAYYMNEQQIDHLLEKYVTQDTKILGLSTTYLFRRIDGSKEEDYLHIINPLRKIKQKYPNLKIVLGGPDASTIDFPPPVDYFIDGYGEGAFTKLLNDEPIHTIENAQGIKTIHGLHIGFPDEYRTIWKEEDFIQSHEVLPIEVSRGCIFKCSFCAFPLNGRKKFDYIRSADCLRDEFVYNYEKFGTTRYVLTDDTFNDSVEKLTTLRDALSDLPFTLGFVAYIKPELLVRFPEMIPLLSDLGLEHPSYGLETMHRQARKVIKKGYSGEEVLDRLTELKEQCLKRTNGLIFTGMYNMIVGLPYETEETLIKNLEYVESHPSVDNTTWNAMSIQDPRNRVGRTLSDIDLNPEKYGYKVGPIEPLESINPNKMTAGFRSTNLMYWRNETNNMDYFKAFNITKKYFIDSFRGGKISGFQTAGLRSCGFDLTKHFNETDGSYDAITDEQINQMIDNITNHREQYYLQLMQE